MIFPGLNEKNIALEMDYFVKCVIRQFKSMSFFFFVRPVSLKPNYLVALFYQVTAHRQASITHNSNVNVGSMLTVKTSSSPSSPSFWSAVEEVVEPVERKTGACFNSQGLNSLLDDAFVRETPVLIH